MRPPRPALALAAALLLAGCGSSSPPPLPALDSVPVPDAERVESVLFLLGDAGNAHTDRSPLLRRLESDIESWAARLEADSAVALLVLGDVVYPEGLRAADAATFHADTAIVMSQVRLVSGPAALDRGARAYFMAGNHDWGLRPHWPGFIRLKHLETFLEATREATGASVHLAPEPGSGGPHLVEWGRHLRLLLLDTAWWLLDSDPESKAAVLYAIEEALEGAGGREVLIAAHHPFRSAGPHGGERSFWKYAGVRYLLSRSGALLQDISSIPYRELEHGLLSIFERQRPPLAFIGGHEHSLQVISAVEPNEPRYSLVSGSGSKLTRVGDHPGLRFGHSAPGYMRLVVERDGAITLFVEAAPAGYLECPGRESARERCMEEGVASFRTVYFRRLR